MLLRLSAALLLVSTATVAVAQSPGISAQRLSDDIRVLASDEFEGRAPATPGEEKTVAYITEQMKKAGLEPGGENGGWTQSVTLNRNTNSNVSVTFKEAGKSVPVNFPNEIALNTRRANAKPVSIKDAPMVFVGYGVKAPELGWDDYKGVDLKGKIALVLINDPDFETAPGKFGGKTQTYYGRWTYKYEELARQGAAGAIIIHERAGASFGWEVILVGWAQPLYGITRPDSEQIALEGWLQRDIAARLFKSAGLDLDDQKRKAQRADFRPVELKGATFSTSFGVQSDKIVTRNVIGKLTGTKRPDETVIVGAHWDHSGVGEPDAKGDRIFNGASDNASGVAGVLELGRAFARAPRTERTLVFMTYTAEERGLLGAEFYAENPIYPLAKTAAVFNFDGLPLYGPTRNIAIAGQGKTELEEDLVRLAKLQNRRVDPEATPEKGTYYRSDHFALAKFGVPALYFHAGQDLVNGGTALGSKLAREYNDQRYHQRGDEWRADFNFGGAIQDLDLVFGLMREVGNTTKWPQWKPTSEFKPARDKSEAERR